MWNPFAEDTGAREEAVGGPPQREHRSCPPVLEPSSGQSNEVELTLGASAADDEEEIEMGVKKTASGRDILEKRRRREKRNSFRNAPVKSIFNRTKVDGRQKTAKKFFTSIKHANTQLGSLSLYGKPYFVIVFVVAAATMATCQYVGMTYYTNDAEITASFIEERGQHEKSESYDIYKEVLDIDSPSSFLSDLSFTRYATIVLWITTVVTGLGAEAIVGTAMSEFAAEGDSKSKIGWNFAQLVFSLFALVSLFSRSVFGLPFLVVGLYKCGYPETLGFLLHAENIGRVNLTSISYFLQGMAVLIHHAAAAFVVCNVITEMYLLTRPLLAIVMPLIVQHWFALLKYENRTIHDLVCVILEVVFEWETFGHLRALSSENGFDMTCRGTALTMLAAHWMFLLAGMLDVIRNLHICCEEHEEFDLEEETFEEEGCGESYDVEDPSSPGSSLEDTNDQVMLNEAHKVDSVHFSDGLGLDEEASSPKTGLKRQISRTPTARPTLGGKQDTLNSMTKAFSDHRKTLHRKSFKNIARAERMSSRRGSGIPRRENSYPRSSAERTPKTSDQQMRASSDSRLGGGFLSLGISPFQANSPGSDGNP
mmetsp:Transcript_31074/g.71833  ORF Transcript_31074/g.71833 Transcript_31074/m.71833 type:complete len:595 (+) Transcript_31074:268-2052(+)